eukprot:TRINITY_DN18723_c0_g1_i1.p1 TRINITY_DN18723_c0_g1~~TRINITY_DN18723_c0_g1_i1.p1  ORF type:complete len:433 (+),score=76.95 TRINITY_DN18723_c0_g1_i1:44-1300(+)
MSCLETSQFLGGGRRLLPHPHHITHNEHCIGHSLLSPPGAARPLSSLRVFAQGGKGDELDPLLLRVARGEDAERTPVWLMRQAGRYMTDFRKYSDKFPFRMRSETPDIAIELSLQPWRAFRPDGVIFFSDILTILPALGVEFDMIKGKGPCIAEPVRSLSDVTKLRTLDDPDKSLPFIRQILSSLRKEIDNETTLLGFVGAPWTLAAYAIEGIAEKSCSKTKQMMGRDPATLHALLNHLTDALIVYVCHQIDSGAQVMQLFDSWAHHLSGAQFEEFAMPYAERVMAGVRALRPGTPLIYHLNGNAGKLTRMASTSADVVGLDWYHDLTEARSILGTHRVLQGNVDPAVLFWGEDAIRAEVSKCLAEGGGRHHILNVGHGVMQGTPEEAVALFCQLARESGNVKRTESSEASQSELLAV